MKTNSMKKIKLFVFRYNKKESRYNKDKYKDN